MKAILNTLLESTAFDSAAPSGTATLVHTFEHPGTYSMVVLREDGVVARFGLTVGAEAPDRKSIPEHVIVDVHAIQHQRSIGSTPDRDPLLVRPGGSVAFRNSGHSEPYAVVAQPVGDAKVQAYDTRRLEQGDIFAVTLIRPGEYAISNQDTKSEGRVVVSYPVIGAQPYRPPSPVFVDCGEKGFDPQRIELKPAQGIVFRVLVPSRIKIKLIRPDDGPKDQPQHKFRLSGVTSRKIAERWRHKRAK